MQCTQETCDPTCAFCDTSSGVGTCQPQAGSAGQTCTVDADAGLTGTCQGAACQVRAFAVMDGQLCSKSGWLASSGAPGAGGVATQARLTTGPRPTCRGRHNTPPLALGTQQQEGPPSIAPAAATLWAHLAGNWLGQVWSAVAGLHALCTCIVVDHRESCASLSIDFVRRRSRVEYTPACNADGRLVCWSPASAGYLPNLISPLPCWPGWGWCAVTAAKSASQPSPPTMDKSVSAAGTSQPVASCRLAPQAPALSRLGPSPEASLAAHSPQSQPCNSFAAGRGRKLQGLQPPRGTHRSSKPSAVQPGRLLRPHLLSSCMCAPGYARATMLLTHFLLSSAEPSCAQWRPLLVLWACGQYKSSRTATLRNRAQ